MMRFGYSHNIAVELDGLLYDVSGNRLEQVADLKDLNGDYWLISDMPESITSIRTIEAPPKYAEIMARKQLQEAGEFDGTVSVVSHWRKRKRQNTTDLFFTALPSRLYNNMLDKIQDKEDIMLLFPLYRILFSVILHSKEKAPLAVVFQHGRFTDAIVATSKRVYHANRCVAFDTSEEQIATLWSTTLSDLKSVEAENRMKIAKVIVLNWIDSGNPPDVADDGHKIVAMDAKTVEFYDETHTISFLNAIKMAYAVESVATPFEKMAFYSKKGALFYQAVFLIVTIAMLAGGWMYVRKANLLETEGHAIANAIAGIRLETPLTDATADYSDSLAFVQQLNFYKTAPGYKKVIQDLSDAHYTDLELDVLKVDYIANVVQIEVFGIVRSSFENAYEGYQRFLAVLEEKGYTIAENRFDTTIKDSQFLIKLTKIVQ